LRVQIIRLLIIIIVFSGLSFKIYSFDEDSEVSIGVKRGVKINKNTNVTPPPRKSLSDKGKKSPVQDDSLLRINTKKNFEKIKKQNTLAFLIGNDNYQPKSNFTKLKECFSDVKLLKQIFIHCVKADSKNIFINKDLTLDEFKKRIKMFLEKVKLNPTANVIISFSGHGNEDGSLVFVDGGMLSPKELKSLVNSYSNDTILIIDACYSGGNEGPKEMLKGVKKDEFKKNSIRVYASLAHLSAKEIQYNNTFFLHIKKFYRETLEIKDIPKGNGYFTAMIGMFFAEYKLKEDENISFNDLVSFVTNRGKQYVEYLAMWGQENAEQKKFAKVRLNQQPKILPIQERVNFLDENHQFILIQKPLKPFGLEPGLTLGLFFPMGKIGKKYNSLNLIATVFTSYDLSFLINRFYLNFNLSYIGVNSKSGATSRDIGLSIVTSSFGVKYYPVALSLFTLSVGFDAGPAFTFARYGSFGPVKEESKSVTDLYLGFETGFKFKIIRNFYVVSPIRFIYLNYKDEPLYGLSASLGASYYF